VLQDKSVDFSVQLLRLLVQGLPSVIYEHPAVGSVNWDVIYCTITAVTWIVVNGGNPTGMLER